MCAGHSRCQGYLFLCTGKGDGTDGRCSKSVVLNLMLMESISPALNGRFYAHMSNGEKLMITRQFVPKLKRIVMGGPGNEE